MSSSMNSQVDVISFDLNNPHNAVVYGVSEFGDNWWTDSV